MKHAFRLLSCVAAVAFPSACWAQAEPADGKSPGLRDLYTTTVSSPVWERWLSAALGIVVSAQPATAAFNVKCTETTTYSIGISDGGGRRRNDGCAENDCGGTSSDTLTYSLYQDSSHGTLWGDDEGERMTDREGTGGAQSYTVYGLIPAQDMPPPDSYSDTVTIMVRF